MASAPLNPLDVPPYQLQPLISTVVEGHGLSAHVTCAQAMGSEIYVGCSNGELLRFALQADDPNAVESYSLLSRQHLPNNKAVEQLVLAPSISRALILSDHQIHFFTLPALDIVAAIKPIRHVITFAVDEQHLKRPAPSFSGPAQTEPIEFCVIKRNTINMYSLREKLVFQKEVPLPAGAIHAKRTGLYLCVADKEYYNVVNLEAASLVPMMPLSQAPEMHVKPSITVISDHEFLILTWTGSSTLGLFITGDGDPVRGTLEWPSYPVSLCMDFPYITTLLTNNTIEIHNVDTQAIVQVISAPPSSRPGSPASRQAQSSERLSLSPSPAGYLVPSKQRSAKMSMTKVPLLRKAPAPLVS